MNRQKIKMILSRAFIGFLSLAMAICLYFILLRFDTISDCFSSIISILKPIIMGAILAYLLRKPCDILEQRYTKLFPEKLKKYADTLAVSTVFLAMLFIFYLFLAMLLPELVKSVNMITTSLPHQVKNFTDWANSISFGNEKVSKYINTFIAGIGDELNKWSKTDLLPTLQTMMGSVALTVGSVFSWIGQIFVGLILTIYMLLSRKRLTKQLKAVLLVVFKEKRTEKLTKELRFIDRTFMGFISGKILDSAIVGFICYGFCLILEFTRGLENSMLISVIVGVTNMIPYFGNMIGLAIGGFLILIENPVTFLIFAVFILVLQQVDGNIIGPKLLANSVGLSGLWVLVAITLFGGLFGFIGVLFGVPVFAIIYEYISRFVNRELRKMNRMDVLQEKENITKK